jgi:hypothetical protein
MSQESEKLEEPTRGGIFLCHNNADKDFARQLAADLAWFGVTVWIDEAEIKIGDSLIQKIEQGINSMGYLGVILSPESVASEWVQREVEIAMNQEIQGRRVKVLPLLYKYCSIPGFILGKRYADFTSDDRYYESLELVLEVLGKQPEKVDVDVKWPRRLYKLPYRDASDEVIRAFDAKYLMQKLDESWGNLTRAAKSAQIDKKTFYMRWMRAGLPSPLDVAEKIRGSEDET